MKILVTGGAGFIGSHVADALLAAGHRVHIVDDLSSGRRENLPRDAAFHEIGITDPGIADLMAAEKFEVITHHAAQMDVRKSVADPGFDATVNVLGLLNLMESARDHGLKKVIFASTGGAIYGEPETAPQDESHPIRPLSPYGITKRTSELYLDFYRHTYGIDYVALRYANVYGPRQNPHGEAGVVAIFSERLLRGETPTIFGDGRQTRDYVYVGDVVRANTAALGLDGSDVVNIGTGVETDVTTLYAHIRDAAGSTADPVHADGKPGEQRRSVLDNAKARRVLDWQPQTPIAEGLGRTVAWFRDRAA